MTRHLRFAPILAIALFLAGCQGPCEKLSPIAPIAPTLNGNADFSSYVAAGTSLSAGFESGGLVDRHQVHAFTAVFAQQVGKTVRLDGTGTFSQPTVNGDGSPPLLEVQSFSPLVISNSGRTDGVATNFTWPKPYSDLGVPSSLAFDFANTFNYGSGYFPLVARTIGSIQSQVLAQAPTFISLEYGANEVLGPASEGTSIQPFPIMTPGAYSAFMTAAVDTLHYYAPNAKIALCNVPDVTSIPFFTTFKPYTVQLANGQPISLVGPGGVTMQPTDLVLLNAADSLAVGTGFPVGAYNYTGGLPGNGRPLLDEQVLNSSEESALEGDIQAMNTTVSTLAGRPYVALVDINATLANLSANGITIGPTTYTTAFIRGGLFSLDGVHPTDLGYAVMANAMIDGVNAKFGTNVPEANPLLFATATASGAIHVQPESAMPLPTKAGAIRESLRRLYRR
jgi:hypothetical protein